MLDPSLIDPVDSPLFTAEASGAMLLPGVVELCANATPDAARLSKNVLVTIKRDI